MARAETDDADDLLSALRFGVDSYAASVADDGCVDDLEQMLAEGAFDEAAHLAHACAVRQAEFERTDWVATGWRELGDPTLPEPVKAYIATMGMEKMIELQQYINKPPGKGIGVVYVQISPVNKMYAGQHVHGAKGESFRISRMDKRKKPGCRHVYNSFHKYGFENFTHIILHHGPEGQRRGDPVDGDCNEREIYFIDHWDLLRPEVGMNLKAGGNAGVLSLEVRAKIREKMLQPEVREANSARAVAAEAARVAAGRPSLPELAAAWKAGNPEKWSRIMSEAQSRPEVREAHRASGIAQWANANEETRSAWCAATSAAMLRPEVREATRKRATAQAEREEAANPGARRRRAAAAEASRVAAGESSLAERAAAWRTANSEDWSRIMSEAQSRPEVREAHRASGIAQFAREEATNPGGRSRRASAQWADADDETRAAWVAANSKSHLRPEVRETSRRSAIAQAEREEAANPGGRSRRAIEWHANNPEKVAAAGAKKRATTLRKRQKRLDDAPDDAARAKLQKQFDKEDRNTERKRQKKTCDAGSSAAHAAGA